MLKTNLFGIAGLALAGFAEAQTIDTQPIYSCEVGLGSDAATRTNQIVKENTSRLPLFEASLHFAGSDHIIISRSNDEGDPSKGMLTGSFWDKSREIAGLARILHGECNSFYWNYGRGQVTTAQQYKYFEEDGVLEFGLGAPNFAR